MATRHLIFFLLQEIFHQRSVTGNRITSSNYVITESHSQIMTDMTTSGRPQVEGALDGLSDNDTKLSDLNRKRRYFLRNRPENDTRATSQKQKIDENLKLCIFKPTEDT